MKKLIETRRRGKIFTIHVGELSILKIIKASVQIVFSLFKVFRRKNCSSRPTFNFRQVISHPEKRSS